MPDRPAPVPGPRGRVEVATATPDGCPARVGDTRSAPAVQAGRPALPWRLVVPVPEGRRGVPTVPGSPAGRSSVRSAGSEATAPVMEARTAQAAPRTTAGATPRARRPVGSSGATVAAPGAVRPAHRPVTPAVQVTAERRMRRTAERRAQPALRARVEHRHRRAGRVRRRGRTGTTIRRPKRWREQHDRCPRARHRYR